jgi:hypothetical protein
MNNRRHRCFHRSRQIWIEAQRMDIDLILRAGPSQVFRAAWLVQTIDSERHDIDFPFTRPLTDQRERLRADEILGWLRVRYIGWRCFCEGHPVPPRAGFITVGEETVLVHCLQSPTCGFERKHRQFLLTSMI